MKVIWNLALLLSACAFIAQGRKPPPITEAPEDETDDTEDTDTSDDSEDSTVSSKLTAI